MKIFLIVFLLILDCFPMIYAQDVQILNRQPSRFKALYHDCANELSIRTSSKYNIEELSFEAENGEIQAGSKKGDLIIIPKSHATFLKIFHKGSLIHKERFMTRFVASPHLQILIGNEQVQYNLGNHVDKEQLTEISFEANIDKNIALDIPQDCQFQVAHVELFLARSGELIGEPIISTSSKADLRQLMANAKQGDRLVVYIRRVERLNYKGEWEEALLYQNERIITIGIE